MKKFSYLLLLIISAVLVLAACSGKENGNEGGNGNQNESGNADGDLLAKVKNSSELLVGTEGTYAPFTFHDESGKLTGFDVEIVEEIASRLGVKAKFMETQWDAMFPGLDSERFDMIANQVGIKPERQEKYDFSDPYISSSAVLVTQADNNDVKAFEDIKGLKSAQSLTSNYGEIAKSYGAELVGIDGFIQAIELLNSNRVDVTINDKLTVLDYQKQKPEANIKIVAEADDAAQSGLMFRKGSETLVEAVNKALNEMIEDGTYNEISEKWFGENVLE
ncbi:MULTISPECIES: amino acid ABC transporter substrate-binding protein [Psychrobacillus]|uniref:Amino acid ABC transporter substrate-binding protein n=1 Tax=Psychrobacillus faecigallinarum TaxID=2762235 RepID=A0ABR8R6U5_9BACI|nr:MULTISPECIES: amino acid ABC transporter substrate-binding protein [Psychrobacillus]MBD7943504.1 amino acid ABC transporter substrate-binding protein [Psychrobacillus faecigallinarum]QEY22665.1 amino acid ABC transporter substrate-binding protein [Psychrobacillus sp. AK 1817]